MQYGNVVLCAWVEGVGLICALLVAERKLKSAEDLGSRYLTAVPLNRLINCVARLKKLTKLTWPLLPSPHIHSEVEGELCIAEIYIAVPFLKKW